MLNGHLEIANISQEECDISIALHNRSIQLEETYRLLAMCLPGTDIVIEIDTPPLPVYEIVHKVSCVHTV